MKIVTISENTFGPYEITAYGVEKSTPCLYNKRVSGRRARCAHLNDDLIVRQRMDDKTDRRVRKTKKQLRQALTALMMEKSVSEITVREIAELADVNRGTFYAHYKDVSDLLSQLEENVFRRLDEISVIDNSDNWDVTTVTYLTDIMTLCGDNADIYRALICRNNDLEFQQRLFEVLKGQYMRGFLHHYCTADAGTLDFYCSFIVSGMLSITKDWMNNGLRQTPRQMAVLGAEFILRGAQILR